MTANFMEMLKTLKRKKVAGDKGRYKLKRMIAKGRFGVVWKAKIKKRKVAIRLFKQDDSQNHERTILEKLKPFNCNHLMVFEDEVVVNGYHGLVVPLCHGDLFQYLKIHPWERMAPTMVFNLAEQMLEALTHLYNMDIIHMDIKPNNILVYKEIDGANNLRFILSGFRDSTELNKVEGEFMYSRVGNFLYRSIDTVLNLQYNKFSDGFSLGMVLANMLIGKLPFLVDSDATFLHSFNATFIEIPQEMIVQSPQRNIFFDFDFKKDEWVLKEFIRDPNKRKKLKRIKVATDTTLAGDLFTHGDMESAEGKNLAVAIIMLLSPMNRTPPEEVNRFLHQHLHPVESSWICTTRIFEYIMFSSCIPENMKEKDDEFSPEEL